MTGLTRWQPSMGIFSLREAMDRLLDDAFTRPHGVFDGWQAPLMDMYETDDEVIVKAAVPGLRPEDLEITVTGDVLTIRGEIQEETESKEGSYHLRERQYGSFSRTLGLPVPVDADRANAGFADGVVTLSLPKTEDVRPRFIQVKARETR